MSTAEGDQQIPDLTKVEQMEPVKVLQQDEGTNSPQCPSTPKKEIIKEEIQENKQNMENTQIPISSSTVKDKEKTKHLKDKTPRYKRPNITKKESVTNAKKPGSSIPVAVIKALPTSSKDTKPPTRGTYLSHAGPQQTTPKGPDKKTLELQFMKNKKILIEMQTALQEKQRPIKEKYKTLLRTQKQLEELGKIVSLDDIQVDCSEDVKSKEQSVEQASGQAFPVHIKESIDDMLNTFSDSYKSFIKRQEEIVKLLNAKDVNDEHKQDLDALKGEIVAVQHNFEEVVSAQERRIDSLVDNWQNSCVDNKKEQEYHLKIAELEEKIRTQERSISESNKTIHNFNKKLDEQKVIFDKSLAENLTKLEEELKKEKKINMENLSRNKILKSKCTEFEQKCKILEDNNKLTTTQLKQLQIQLKDKEIEWMKEKEELNKIIEVIKEKRTALDKRMKTMEDDEQKYREDLETLHQQLEEHKDSIEELENEKKKLSEKIKGMENQLSRVKSSGDNEEKIKELEGKIKEQSDELERAHESLKQHAQLAVALKLEKDSAVKYSNHIRETLREAKEEIDSKTKTIYKLHENLVLKETTCEKLKERISKEQKKETRCHICGKRNDWDALSIDTTKVGNNYQLVSESLIGMSVKKVDKIRERIDNLKRFQLGKFNKLGFGRKITKQIELKAKLYEILQKHADESCEDFINLLKLTASTDQNFDTKPSNFDEQKTELNSSSLSFWSKKFQF